MIGNLTLAGGTGGRPWRIAAQAPVEAGRTCLGLSPAEAVGRLSGLFSLCGAAHGAAAAGALGLAVDASAEGAMRGEILRDHAIALLMDWPVRLGLLPARGMLSRLVAGRGDDAAALYRDLTGPDAEIGAPYHAGLAARLYPPPAAGPATRPARHRPAPFPSPPPLPPADTTTLVLLLLPSR